MGKKLRRSIGATMIGTALSYPVVESYTDESIVEKLSDNLSSNYLNNYEESFTSEPTYYVNNWALENNEEISGVLNFTHEILTSLS